MKSFTKDRETSVSLLKREKIKYYNNIDLKIFEDNKKFWRSIKPLLSDKQKFLNRNITIMEDDEIFSENPVVAEKLNNFFIVAAQSLEIEPFFRILILKILAK